MRRQGRTGCRAWWCAAVLMLAPAKAGAEDGYELWLRYRREPEVARRAEYAGLLGPVRAAERPSLVAARAELERALPVIAGAGTGQVIIGVPEDHPALGELVPRESLREVGPEGFCFRAAAWQGRPVVLVAGNTDVGVLRGTFALLRHLQLGRPLVAAEVRDRPRVAQRIANHWDNPWRAPTFRNESIERGYAGESLFRWDELPGTIDPRLRDWARLLAAMGMNGVMLNNVNTAKRGLEGWRLLTPAYRPKLAALADLLRPYGVRIYVSVNFFSPKIVGGLDTADPADPRVGEWWRQLVADLYAVIPDFGGFLVKADSEGEPGPMVYGRSHAEGANLIAAALRPHGGAVHWRAFVYDRSKGDRVVQAYRQFAPLDGQFAENVFIQIKNGPLDFQIREPVSALLGAMPRTNQLLELQITQEYTGQDRHVCFLAPLWQEVFAFDTHRRGPGSTIARLVQDELYPITRNGVVGVMNTGDSRNWTGHDLAQANTFALGRLAWDPGIEPRTIAEEWAALTFGRDPRVVAVIADLLLESRAAYEDYTSPLGLNHMTRRVDHFVPDPIYRIDHHGATKTGVGFDRTEATGTGYAGQFAEPWRSRYERRETCPEELLLFFHHVPWEHRLANGQLLIQELYDRYFAGAARVRDFVVRWEGLRGLIDDERHARILRRLRRQVELADGWVGTLVPHWMEFSDTPDARSRLIPQPHSRVYEPPGTDAR